MRGNRKYSYKKRKSYIKKDLIARAGCFAFCIARIVYWQSIVLLFYYVLHCICIILSIKCAILILLSCITMWH